MKKQRMAGGPTPWTHRSSLTDDTESDPSEDTIETYTGALHHPELPFAMTMPYGRDPNTVQEYRAVPYDLAQVQARHRLPMWAWRIEFHSLAPGAQPMGLDVLGPIILGRATPHDTGVDIDFSPYDGATQGVSRRHALIRPSEEHLYLIDLSSTNGTRRSGVPLGAGMAVSLADRDTITLGMLTFEVHIIKHPDPNAPKDSWGDKSVNDTRPIQLDGGTRAQK